MLRGKAVTLLGDNIARGTENLSKWEHDWLCCLNKSPRSCNWDFLFSLWLWLFSLILWCFFQWLWRRLGLHFHELIFHLVHHNSFPILDLTPPVACWKCFNMSTSSSITAHSSSSGIKCLTFPSIWTAVMAACCFISLVSRGAERAEGAWGGAFTCEAW